MKIFLPTTLSSHVTDIYFAQHFQSKFDLKKHMDTKVTFFLFLYQFDFTDVFFRESIIESWKINP